MTSRGLDLAGGQTSGQRSLGRLRNAALVLALFATFLFAAAANLSFWSNGTVLNTDRFVARVGRVLDSPEVVDAFSGRLADAVLGRVQAAIGQPNPDPRLLGLLLLGDSTPQQLVHDALKGAIAGIMTSPQTDVLRDSAVQAVHEALLRFVSGSGTISVQDDRLVIDLGQLAALLPLGDAGQNVDGQIVVAQGDRLQLISQSFSVMQTLQLLLPIVTIVAGFVAVAIARRRRRIFGWVGAGLVAAGLLDLILAALAADWVVGQAPESSRAAALAVVQGLLQSLVIQSVVLVATGAVIVVGATVFGFLSQRRT